MQTQIKTILQNLEKEKNITILYACESGSRAWGFPSPDSDYDFRFIYQHEKNWYLSVNEKTDSISVMPNKLLDGSGWDFRKALRLLLKSNASIFEWINSPIVYFQNEKFITQFRALANEYFNPKNAMFHYLGIATGMLQKEFREDTVKIKKYFYVLRPVLAAYWIGLKKSPAPMEFERLLELVEDEKVLKNIQALLKKKETAAEGERVLKNPILDNFIKEIMEECEILAKEMPKVQREAERVNRFYRERLSV